jgi:hypothetical protein
MNTLKTMLARLTRRCLPAFILAVGLVTTASAATITVTTLAQFTAALSAVQPGDTIEFSGTIDTSSTKLATTRAGTSSAPITIRGVNNAVIKSRASYAMEILHDYYRLSNFRIEGTAGSTSGSPGKGLVITSADHGVVDNVHIRCTDQEAFKIRNQSQYWLFTFCSARNTGLQNDYGEGFYVGQAASNWVGDTPDASGYVTFFNCYTIDTYNDGWDIKEGAHHVKMINCTADYSGSVEPPFDHARGSDGWYIRADHIQVVKCSVKELGNTGAGYRFSNQTVDGIDYGSTGNEIKQSAIIGGNGALIFSEGGTNGKVYTDCVPGPGGLLDAGTSASSITQPSPSSFVEMTWSGEGGGIYGNLDSDIGAPDPLGNPPTPTVVAPGFSPGGGTYTSAQNVTITTSTSGATIRYTTNGSNPTSTSGTVYSGPVAISATATLKAIAYKSGSTDSAVTSATYTINTSPTQVAAPSFNPGGGTYTSAQSVTITSATSGVTIRYTTNGTNPTSTSGTVYAGPVSIGATSTLKAIAYKSGMTDSAVTTASYTINTGGSSLLTDNFNGGTTGSAPGGWTVSASSGTTATVQAFPSSSDKSLRFTDTSTSNYSQASRTFAAQTGVVTLEFSFYASANWCRFFLRSGSTIGVEMYTKDGQLIYRNSSGADVNITPYTANTWTTVRIVANASTDRFDVYVGGVLRGSNLTFRNAASNLDTVLFSSGGSSTGTNYIDNVLVTN